MDSQAQSQSQFAVKTNRKMLKVEITLDNKPHSTRFFDFAHHGARNEYIKLTSWALKHNAILSASTAYVE